MERLTEWNDEQTRHAYYPRCFEEPCYGGGCKIKDCPFETAVCDRLAAYEDTGLSPEKVSWMKEVVEAAFDNDTSIIEREHNLHVADKEGRAGGFAQSAERNGGYEGWLNRYFFWSYAI